MRLRNLISILGTYYCRMFEAKRREVSGQLDSNSRWNLINKNRFLIKCDVWKVAAKCSSQCIPKIELNEYPIFISIFNSYPHQCLVSWVVSWKKKETKEKNSKFFRKTINIVCKCGREYEKLNELLVYTEHDGNEP